MHWIVLVAVWQTFKVVTASNTKALSGCRGKGRVKMSEKAPELMADL